MQRRLQNAVRGRIRGSRNPTTSPGSRRSPHPTDNSMNSPQISPASSPNSRSHSIPSSSGNRQRTTSTSPRPVTASTRRNASGRVSGATTHSSIPRGNRYPIRVSRGTPGSVSRDSSSASQRSNSSSRTTASHTRTRRTRPSSAGSMRTRRGSRNRGSQSSTDQEDLSSERLPLLPDDSQISTVSTSRSVIASSSSNRSPFRRRRTKSRVSFVLPEVAADPSVMRVMESEKCLQKIFTNLNWNELLVVRQVCKKWLEVISSDPKLKESSGVITIRKDFDVFLIFNESSVIWTQFRIYAPIIIDLSVPFQAEFWRKHGTSITFLEVRSPCMTLKGLVDVLHHCPNLVHFLVSWTPEMYSFNPELIKKYYGISIRNGTFAKMTSLAIEKTSFLTDNALLSILKWCGSSLQSLSLTCSEDDIDASLSRLKPRWTIEPFENYTCRFSYAKNLKSLDFSGSNLNSADLVQLGGMEKLSHLTGIKLSRCKINDESALQFLRLKGPKLEQLYLDFTPITENIFDVKANKDLNLKKLQLLDISGTPNVRNLNFLSDMTNLEDLRCADTPWMNYSLIMTPIETLHPTKRLTKLNLSNGEKLVPKNMDDKQRTAWFLRFCLSLKKLEELNLDYWTTFGTDENFKLITNHIQNLKKLRVRGWSNLTDEGVIGFSFEDLQNIEESSKNIWSSTRLRLQKQALAKLKSLTLVDFGGCLKLTDVTIQYGILYLSNLRALSLDGSQVTDVGVHVLIARCTTLDKLSLLSCDLVTPKGKKINRLDGRAVQFGSIKTN